MKKKKMPMSCFLLNILENDVSIFFFFEKSVFCLYMLLIIVLGDSIGNGRSHFVTVCFCHSFCLFVCFLFNMYLHIALK